MEKGGQQMHPVEIAHAKRWSKDEGMTPNRIATLLQRDPQTIRNHLAVKKGNLKTKRGRPPMSEADYKKCDSARVSMQKAAKATKEITVAMVKKRAGVPYCERVIRNAFRKHGKPFKKLREKPLLKKEDVEARKKFGRKYGHKSYASWVTSPHTIIDNKRFPMYLNGVAREHAARRSCRGAYRGGKDAVAHYLVKFPAQGVMVAAAVIAGRIRMWHIVDGRWNSKKAVQMYAGPLLKAMSKAFPAHAAKPRSKWLVPGSLGPGEICVLTTFSQCRFSADSVPFPVPIPVPNRRRLRISQCRFESLI